MKYRVSLGFKHWEVYEVEAESKEAAVGIAEEMHSNGMDSVNWIEDRCSEFDEIMEG